jgi:hypothetical protein
MARYDIVYPTPTAAPLMWGLQMFAVSDCPCRGFDAREVGLVATETEQLREGGAELFCLSVLFLEWDVDADVEG